MFQASKRPGRQNLRRRGRQGRHVEAIRQPADQGVYDKSHAHGKVGISDYQTFALDLLKAIPDRPISFEVFSDEFEEMARERG